MARYLLLIFLLSSSLIFAQPVGLFKQYTGNYDFFMFGNTMNTVANGTGSPCTVLTQSSAVLNLPNNINIEAAFLYWSGSGDLDTADLNVDLNGTPIAAERTFTVTGTSNLTFFGAFADVTNFVRNTGNVTYTLSNLDVSSVLPAYCPTGSNYAGWSILVIYEDAFLPNRIITVYEGFQIVDSGSSNLSLTLSGLNVTNSVNSKIGFLAWEGDANISITEELRINNQLVSNPPLNPSNNTFNGTNSYTNANNLWNMDMDFYNIGNYISIGDKQMHVTVKSGQDLIIINNIVVGLSSLIADATIQLNDVKVSCDSREINVDYTVFNNNSTGALIAKVPISFYANNQYVGKSQTKNVLQINEFETGSIKLTIPDDIPLEFTLRAYVDDDGTSLGSVVELDEENNIDDISVKLIVSPQVNKPSDLILCDDDEDGFVGFDLSNIHLEAAVNSNNKVTFHESEVDAKSGVNRLQNINHYEIKSYSTKVIWVRVEDTENGCANVTSFRLIAQKKPLLEITDPLMICNYKDNPKAANLNLAYFILDRMVDYMKDVELKFYPSETDAENGTNEILNLDVYYPPSFPYTVYIKVIGKTTLWCNNIISMQLNDCVIPKGVSPNGDGMNDGFDLAIFNLIELKIFNRYGMEIYEHGIGYTNQWQGQNKSGGILPSGTYFYIFKTLFDTYSGWVQLMHQIEK